jgi:hypothetical protein
VAPELAGQLTTIEVRVLPDARFRDAVTYATASGGCAVEAVEEVTGLLPVPDGFVDDVTGFLDVVVVAGPAAARPGSADRAADVGGVVARTVPEPAGAMTGPPVAPVEDAVAADTEAVGSARVSFAATARTVPDREA